MLEAWTGEVISIHALREEGDPWQTEDRAHLAKFLSTPSARRATTEDTPTSSFLGDFYPRPPRGGRLFAAKWTRIRFYYFYPRPPRGGRLTARISSLSLIHFYPRPPRGGRRFPRSCPRSVPPYFYPRPPRGGRRSPRPSPGRPWQFLSTPSARRATSRGKPYPGSRGISIHALREEGDKIFPR